ncbi:unnamed protein product [Rotaria socialis]|nr:unnamed protein product [Rotaria socialis]
MNSTCRPFKAFGFNETVVLEWGSLLEALHVVFRDYSQTKLFNNQENDDELKDSRQRQLATIAFLDICDGFVDITLLTNDGRTETDETNCHKWQCDNHYTHCNGVWNCPNGADEVACKTSRCSSNQHPCLSSRTYQPIYVSLNQTGNDVIDYLGSYDERSYCREVYPTQPKYRYKCQNSSECVSAGLVCRFSDHYPKDDNRNKCRSIVRDKNLDNYRTTLFDYEMDLSVFQTSKKKRNQRETIKEITNLNISPAWFCNNRGIPIYNHVRHEYACLCPPSHYGNRCQYQNQRIRLTIRFDKENAPHLWHSLLYFSIMLADHHHHHHHHH